MLDDALPTTVMGDRDDTRVPRSLIPRADLVIFETAKRAIAAPIHAFVDQIHREDFSVMPSLDPSGETMKELSKRSSDLRLQPTNADNGQVLLHTQYRSYLDYQGARISRAEPAIITMFETARALQELESGKAGLAERFLNDITAYLPSELEPQVELNSLTGKFADGTSNLLQPVHQDTIATEHDRVETSLQVLDRSGFYRQPCSLAASDQVFEWARSALAEGLVNHAST